MFKNLGILLFLALVSTSYAKIGSRKLATASSCADLKGSFTYRFLDRGFNEQLYDEYFYKFVFRGTESAFSYRTNLDPSDEYTLQFDVQNLKVKVLKEFGKEDSKNLATVNCKDHQDECKGAIDKFLLFLTMAELHAYQNGKDLDGAKDAVQCAYEVAYSMAGRLNQIAAK